MANYPTPKPYLSEIRPYVAGKSSLDPGVTPIKLSSNENPYGPSPKALEVYAKAAGALHRYPDGGCHALREAIAACHGLNPERIICGAGSDELIGLLVHAYASIGDEVIFTEHGFLMYKIYTLMAGATPVEVPETNLKADVDALLAAVTPNTKLVFIANPNNPTGSYLTREELGDLRRRLPAHILLAVDGAYAECANAEDYDSGLELAKTTENTVMLRTFSKLYGLPNLRLGWMLGADAIIDALHRVRSPFNVNGTAQAAGVAAIEDTDYTQEQFTSNLEQKHWLTAAIRELGYHAHDSQGNFTLVDLGSPEQATHIVRSLEQQHIYIRDVSGYKLPHCARITIGTPEENQRLMQALEALRP